MKTQVCMNCRGTGHMCDGSAEFSNHGFRVLKQNTICYVCKGKGKVRVYPVDDNDENKSPLTQRSKT